jgi:hypothetical protein
MIGIIYASELHRYVINQLWLAIEANTRGVCSEHGGRGFVSFDSVR